MKCKIKTDQTGKPDAGNPHVRFDEGEVAPTATPRRGSLLYNSKKLVLAGVLLAASTCAAADGIVMAGGHTLEIKVHGKSAHTAYPEYSANPIVILSRVVADIDSLKQTIRATRPYSVSMMDMECRPVAHSASPVARQTLHPSHRYNMGVAIHP